MGQWLRTMVADGEPGLDFVIEMNLVKNAAKQSLISFYRTTYRLITAFCCNQLPTNLLILDL